MDRNPCRFRKFVERWGNTAVNFAKRVNPDFDYSMKLP